MTTSSGAKGRAVDTERWAAGFAVRKHSALDVWMSPAKKRALRRLVEAGGDVRCRVFECGPDEEAYEATLGMMRARLRSGGWRLFAHEENGGQGEAVLVRG